MNIQIALSYFKSHDPVMFGLLGKYVDSMTLSVAKRPSEYAHELYCSIVSQQLSVKAAATIWKRFVELVGSPGDTARVLAHTIEDYRAIGLSRQKASYILSIAELICNGAVKLDHLHELSNEGVIKELVKIKGVGVWTAEMFLMFTLARSDVFSIGDLGLRNAVTKHYGIDKKDHGAMLELSQKWSPHRTLASLTLWRSLDNKTTNQPV
jgi:DNA-3-methyladenine glycosylase II